MWRINLCRKEFAKFSNTNHADALMAASHYVTRGELTRFVVPADV